MNITLKDLLEQRSSGNKEKSDFGYVNVEEIYPGPWQVRKFFDTLDELEGSVKEYGVLEPLLVKKVEQGKYFIIGGERRWRAAKNVGLTTLPVRIIDASDKKALQISLIENIQRSSLSPIEEANGYQSMLDQGMVQEEVALAVGKSRSHVANVLRLLKLPEKIQAMLQRKELSFSKARALVNAVDAELVLRKTKGKSVRETESVVSGDSEIDEKEVAEQISRVLKMEVVVKHYGKTGKGMILIRYKNCAQMDEFLERIY